MLRLCLLAPLAFLACRGDTSPDAAAGATRSGPSIVLEDFTPPDVAEPRQSWAAGGFVFNGQGAGWRALEGPELAAFGADVKLAVAEGARCRGWALARPAQGVGAHAAADAARAQLGWEALAVHVDEDTKYDLWTARRYEVQGRLDGRTIAERASWWVEGDRLYAVVARSDERDYGSRRRCMDRVTAGFSLGAP